VRYRSVHRRSWPSPITTANGHYAIRGIRAGESVKTVAKHVKLGKPISANGHTWYVLSDGSVTAIVQASKGVASEIGIADKGLTKTDASQKRLLASIP
jgi:hypothetical protein